MENDSLETSQAAVTDDVDESASLTPPPLSTAARGTGIPTAAAAGEIENLDEIDPFSFKPSFTLCDKLLVSLLENHFCATAWQVCLKTSNL